LVYKTFDKTKEGLVRVLNSFIKLKRSEGFMEVEKLASITNRIRKSSALLAKEKKPTDSLRSVEGVIQVSGGSERVIGLMKDKMDELRKLMKRYQDEEVREFEKYLTNLQNELTMTRGHIPVDNIVSKINEINKIIEKLKGRDV
jgi:ppGpp synthetase/RelA/SpoT-type nucleotidyltranferase